MTVRVAELEAVFTGKDSDFDVVADRVEARQKDLDGTTVTAEVDADASAAFSAFDDVLAELSDVDSTSARAVVEADIDEAQDTLQDIADELDTVDQTDATAKVQADVDDVLDDLDKTERALGDLDDEVARPRIDPAGLEEFNDEANSTAREAAASFDGSAESAADAFQEVAANAFAGFGPAGAAAGLAIAAGLGTAIAAVQKIAEENDAAKQSAADMAVAMVEGTHDARDAFREYATTVVEDNPWTFWANEASTNLGDIADDLERLGTTGQTAIGAISSGSLEDMRSIAKDVSAELEVMEASLRKGSDAADFGVGAGELLDLAHSADVAAEASNGLSEADLDRKDSLERVQGVLEEQITSQEDAHEIAVLLKQAEEGLTRAEAELALEIDETNRAMEERVSGSRGVAQAEFDLADAVTNTRDTMKDAEATEQDRKEALFDLSGNIIDLAAAEEEASGKTEDYNKVIKENRRDFIDAAQAAGYTKEEARKLAREYGLIPKKVDTDIEADARQARREARETRRFINDLHAEIDVAADTGSARAEADAVYAYINGLNATIGVTAERHIATGLGGAGGLTFADGGIHEQHVAQIAPAGAWRVWAEPETGGEAYIPLAPSKRQRSMEILEETAGRMGARVVAQADGSVLGGPSFTGPTTAVFSDAQVRILANAMREGSAAVVSGHEAAQDRAARYVRSF